MDSIAFLREEMEVQFESAKRLIELVDDSKLDWKPETGSNWMTTGQLIRHISDACGMGVRAFATGDWGLPEGMKMEDMKPEDMMPPAEKFPSAASKAEALELLEKDRQTAMETLSNLTGADMSRPTPAPWDPMEMPLMRRLNQMILHLKQHKCQLFYYLKLQGHPVNTNHMWYS